MSSNYLEEEVRNLQKRLDQLIHVVEKQVHDRTEDLYGLQDKANKLGKKFRGCCNDWVSSSTDTLSKLSDDAQDGVKQFKKTAESNVFISMGISALVGYVVALIFSRRD